MFHLFFILFLEIRLFAYIQYDNCASDLDSLLMFASHLDVHVIFFNQSPEFGLVVENVETGSVELD
jgi:hypothetical protein